VEQPEKEARMGRIAALAEEHYRKFLPKTYAGLTDRATFFQNLETEAESQIDVLADRLAGEDPPDEEYNKTVGRLRSARQQAEELVMRETVLLDPATVEPEQEPEMPEDQELQTALTDFQDATAELEEQRISSQTRPPNQPDPTTPESPPKA
jgi:hypothetical protein